MTAKKKISARVMAMLLAVVLILSAFPMSAFAAVASDLPDEMADHAILRALEYTGYDVQKQKDDGTLYQSGSYGSRTPTAILSGMKDDEIRAAGFTSLVPFFDREGYAQTIAEFLIDEGTNDTYSGNLHIPFSEINKRYGVNLPTDKEMLDLIRDALLEHGDIISDLETAEDFDMMFYTMYCPYVEDDGIAEDDGERPQFIPQM